MDDRHFDQVTRALAGEAGTRRATLRLLAGGALGILAARLGLAETEAAKKKSKHKRRPERKPQAALQAEGKGKGKKGKGKGRGRKKPPPLPPGCQHCGECQMCQDGACVPDPVLNGVRCLESGATCGYCQGGVCVASVVRPCADGVCPQRDQCCSDEKRCPDPESDLGFACIDPATMCCPDEKRCDSGCKPRIACCEEDRPQCDECEVEVCIRGQYVCNPWCCPGEQHCDDGTCVGPGECCSYQKNCDGVCVAADECCPDQYRCDDGTCVDPFEECCPGQTLCNDGTCVSEGQCCPGEQRCGDSACQPAPSCSSQCGDVVCEDGELICRPRNSGQTCGGPGTACCQGRCYSANCPPASNGRTRHFNPNTCGCECDVVESCPPGRGWSNSTCSCVCNCLGRCCLSGCCANPDGGGAHCCQGF